MNPEPDDDSDRGFNADPAPPGSDSGGLMTRVQQGDAEAFARVVEEHQRAVYAFLHARLSSAGEAEELTQEVFVRCYLARARFDTTSLIRPFLFGIARNVLRERARGGRRRKEVIWTELCLELEQLAPEEEALSDELEAFRRHLPVCLEGLGRSAREAVRLHYQQNLRHAAIGAALSRSVGAVKLLLFRARRALKRCLEAKLRRACRD